MRIESCEGCEHWHPPECHRYPPTHGYPETKRGCGEYCPEKTQDPEPRPKPNTRKKWKREQNYLK